MLNPDSIDKKLPGGRILELDGLRALSVFFVVIYHALLWSEMAGPIYPRVANFISYLGLTGVNIFFVISGFIITRLMMEEKRATGSVSFSRFYIKRAFRIVPPYFFYLLVIWLLGSFQAIDTSKSKFIWNLLFLSNIHVDKGWFTGHSWSLSVEEQYYILFPILIWKLAGGNLRVSALGLAAAYLLAFGSLKITAVVNHWHPGVNFTWMYSFRYIIAGVLLSLGWPAISRTLEKTGLFFFLGMLGTLIVWQVIGGEHPQWRILGFFFGVVEPWVLALLVAWIVCHPAYGGFWRLSPVQWLGKASYSIYLWQQLFLAPAALYLALKLSDPRFSFVCLLAISAFSYYVIERNFIALGRKIISGMKSEPRVAPLNASGI